MAAPLDGGGETAAERPALSRMALNRQAASQPSAVQPTAAQQVLDPYEEATPLADASSPQNNQPFLQSGLQEATFDFSSSKSTLGASNASTESPEKLAAGNVLTPLSEDPTPAPAVQPAAQANSYQAPRRAIPTSDISNVEASFSLADSASSEPPLDDSEVVPEPFSAVSAPSFAQNPSLASSPQSSVRSRPSVQPTRPEQSFSAPEQTSAGGLHAASETSSSRQPSNSRQASSAADPAAMTSSQSVQQNISQPNIQAAGFSNVKTPIAPQDIPEVPAVNASATYEAPKPDIMPEVSDPSAQPKATRRSHYDFPGINLLTDYPPNPDDAQNKADCQSRCQLINQTFTDLGVGASVVSYTIGPSVTRYDVQTNPDVSVSSVSHVVTDISVRLGGVATRYEQLVRGKTTSGLEIVNRTTTTVSFKEVLTALPKADEDHNLFIPFGKSISGDIVYADLSEFPHMLVSGSTGSGKSIFMHGVIMTLIMRNRPEDLKLVVVDPKRVEMAKYKDIPHLLCPIIKEASAAKICFDKLIEEMERRYTLFELSGVSNIRQFNKEYAPSAGVEKLPFIVVVVDEYADLVDSCKDLGERVVRLAQKARAAGIHLVIATQRPSVNVITGVIKANLPVRVALSVASATDSITILGEGGAEDLAGHGDMLVDCSLVSRTGFTRLQGCFVNNKEIKDVADFIHSQIPTVYDPRFLDLVDHAEEEKQAVLTAPTAAEERASKSEDLYSYVKDTIMAREYTSISQIQREFSVGFPRAGKIFAQLQAEGIVASVADSASSSKGCRVLVHGKSSKQSENPGTTEQSSVSAAPAASMDK